MEIGTKTVKDFVYAYPNGKVRIRRVAFQWIDHQVIHFEVAIRSKTGVVLAAFTRFSIVTAYNETVQHMREYGTVRGMTQ
jgi:hypothetical protein